MILKFNDTKSSIPVSAGLAAPEPWLLHRQHPHRPGSAVVRRNAAPHNLHGQVEEELRLKFQLRNLLYNKDILYPNNITYYVSHK